MGADGLPGERDGDLRARSGAEQRSADRLLASDPVLHGPRRIPGQHGLAGAAGCRWPFDRDHRNRFARQHQSEPRRTGPPHRPRIPVSGRPVPRAGGQTQLLRRRHRAAGGMGPSARGAARKRLDPRGADAQDDPVRPGRSCAPSRNAHATSSDLRNGRSAHSGSRL